MELLEIENQIRAYEGTLEENDPALRTVIRNLINECYVELALIRPWRWLVSTTTITALDGDTHLSLPTDLAYLLRLKHPDGTIMEPRDEQRQADYELELSNSSRLYTYAWDDFDDPNDQNRVRLIPEASAGDYELRYTIIPPLLAADTDEPRTPLGTGKTLVPSYLIWRVTSLRLLTNHERRELIGVTEGRSGQLLEMLSRLNGRNPIELKTRLTPRK